MSIVEALHAEHKARLARIASKARPEVKIKPNTEATDLPSLVREVAALRDNLQDWIDNHHRVLTSCDRIQMMVAQHYGVARKDILSPRRTQAVVFPRQVAMFLAKKLTTLSLPQIGRKFGNRDHTTILHSVRKLTVQMETDIQLRASIEMLTEKLGGEPV